MSKILYKVLSWGLGHGTRSLPLLRALVRDGHDVTVASAGRVRRLMQLELGDSVRTVEAPDILTDWGRECHWIFLLRKLWILPHTMRRIEQERQWVADQVRRESYEMVISDSCFGAACNEVPCYLIGHHLKIYWFVRWELLMRFNEWLAARLINRFQKILVPDFEGEDNLAGALSHDFRAIDSTKIHYVGILSDYDRVRVDQDVDYLFSISGSESQRRVFERTIFSQLPRVPGNVVLTCGRPEDTGRPQQFGSRVKAYGFLAKTARDELMNRARLVITRCGYSTLMDLAQLGKQAFLIPTRNQTEQEYLARYHRERKSFHSVGLLKQVRLPRDLHKAAEYPGLRGPRFDTQTSVNRLLELLGL